jgi:hypothetical protein
MPPGSTLVRGAVIVTVMSWECSLSPSSVIDGAGVSQLMLAGRAGQAVEGQARSASKAFTGSVAKAVAAVRLKAPYSLEGNETLSSWSQH